MAADPHWISQEFHHLGAEYGINPSLSRLLKWNEFYNRHQGAIDEEVLSEQGRRHDRAVQLQQEQEANRIAEQEAREEAEAYKQAVLDAAEITLDLAGLADQTGASDVAGAGLAAWRGDLTSAALSLGAALPIVGAIATAAKATKWAQKIRRTVANAMKFKKIFLKLTPALTWSYYQFGKHLNSRFLPKGVRNEFRKTVKLLGEFFIHAAQSGKAWSLGATTRGRVIEYAVSLTEYKALRYVAGWSNKAWDFADDAARLMINFKTVARESVDASVKEVDKLIRETRTLAVVNGYRRVLDVRMKPEDFSKITNAQMDELIKVARQQRVELRFTAYP